MPEKSNTSGKTDADEERQPLRQSLLDEVGRFGQRLRIAATGMDPTDISLKTGVERRSVVNYLAGKNDPSRARVIQLARALGVNIEWLSTGEGPMTKNAADWPASDLGRAQLGVSERPADAYLQSMPPGFVLVPRYDVQAAAGRGTIVEREDVLGYYAYERAWLINVLKVRPEHAGIAGVIGPSMEDPERPESSIYDGDELMLDLSVKQFVGDSIYFVRLEGGLIVKQLQRMVGGGLRIISRNPLFEPQTINERIADSGTDFAIIARVLGKPGFVKL